MDATALLIGLVLINIALIARSELADRRHERERDTERKLAAAERAAATAERAQLTLAFAEERQILLNRIQAPETAIVQTLPDPFAGGPIPSEGEQQEINDALFGADDEDEEDVPIFEVAGGAVEALADDLLSGAPVG